MADFSGIMGLFNKQPPDIPPWVEMTGPMGGQAFTTLTNPMTGETFTAGSTNYRVRNDLYQPTALGGGLADGFDQQPMDSGPRINDMSNEERQRQMMAAMGAPMPPMGGIGAALGGKNDGVGMGPMPDFGKALQPIGEGIKSMDQKLGNIEQKIGQQSPMQQQQTQLGMYGMPCYTAPNPYASSAFGNSLFGGIAPFLMNRYY